MVLPSLPTRDDAHEVRPATLAAFGGLIGDPVRASILLHLGDGTRRPAGELAALAGISPQAASAHLARLLDGGLLHAERHGRHRFYSLASGEVAEMVETLATWVGAGRRKVAHDPALCTARLCYDHVAGRVGVFLLDRMVAAGLVVLGGADGIRLSEAGAAWCAKHAVTMAAGASRRPKVRLCLDWTERRHHLGGRLGAALAARLIDGRMLVPGPRRRTLLVTARGADFLRDAFGPADEAVETLRWDLRG